MNKLILISFFMFSVINGIAQNNTGYFIDNRDGNKYSWVKIGNDIWTAENLRFKTKDSCWCLNDDSTNCKKFGFQYSFNAAKTACPTGWHLPSKKEYEKLIQFYGGEQKAGQGFTNKEGLNVLLGGWKSYYGSYASEYNDTGLWTATSTDKVLAWGVEVNNDGVLMANDIGKECGYYVRCVKDKN